MLPILSLAFALRIGAYFAAPSIHHPDEIFQTLEPANRLLHGVGFVSWEFVWGIRSWLFPALLAAVMWIGALVDQSPLVPIHAVAIVLSLLSLVIVACAYLWGSKASGTLGAVISGLIAAAWPDLVYFGSRPLTEVIATDFLVAGVYLGHGQAEHATRKRILACGFLLGFAFVFRFHLAPAIGLVALTIVGRDWRARWQPMLLGGAVPAAIAGILDWVTWGMPFQSIWLNFSLNVITNVSSEYSVSPWFQYARLLTNYWPGIIALLVLSIPLGARQAPIAVAAALVIVASHSAIGHKEYRFIYPAIPFVALMGGIGTGEIVSRIGRTFGTKRFPSSCIATASACAWLCGFAICANSLDYRALWTSGSGAVLAARAIAHESSVCGISLHGVPWWRLGGYSLMQQRAPVFELSTPAEFAAAAEDFNVVIYADGHLDPGPRFGSRGCWQRDPRLQFSQPGADLTICVAVRSGTCAAATSRPPAPNVPATLR